MERTRRQFLRGQAFGLAGLALPWLLSREGLLAEPVKPFADGIRFDLEPKAPPKLSGLS